jgi:hypothetical protein
MLHNCNEACASYLPRFHARHKHHAETMIAQVLLVFGTATIASMRIAEDYDGRLVAFAVVSLIIAACIFVRTVRDMLKAPVT